MIRSVTRRAFRFSNTAILAGSGFRLGSFTLAGLLDGLATTERFEDVIDLVLEKVQGRSSTSRANFRL